MVACVGGLVLCITRMRGGSGAGADGTNYFSFPTSANDVVGVVRQAVVVVRDAARDTWEYVVLFVTPKRTAAYYTAGLDPLGPDDHFTGATPGVYSPIPQTQMQTQVNTRSSTQINPRISEATRSSSRAGAVPGSGQEYVPPSQGLLASDDEDVEEADK